jgi:hypothetical protein
VTDTDTLQIPCFEALQCGSVHCAVVGLLTVTRAGTRIGYMYCTAEYEYRYENLTTSAWRSISEIVLAFLRRTSSSTYKSWAQVRRKRQANPIYLTTSKRIYVIIFMQSHVNSHKSTRINYLIFKFTTVRYILLHSYIFLFKMYINSC